MMDHADKGNRRQTARRFSAAESSPDCCRATGGGLSVINYPIVRLNARRYQRHSVVPDDSVVKSSDSGERITVIPRRIARKHRSRARERTGLRVINPTIDETYPSQMLRVECTSEKRCRASLFFSLSRSRESLIPLERRHGTRHD